MKTKNSKTQLLTKNIKYLLLNSLFFLFLLYSEFYLISKINKKLSVSPSKIKSNIAIKNNKNTAIEIELLDQYPISKNSQIEVTLEDANGATVTTEYGKLLWKLKLQPNESRKIKLVYTIKYPKDKQVKEGQ
jgi:hypothetical protein